MGCNARKWRTGCRNPVRSIFGNLFSPHCLAKQRFESCELVQVRPWRFVALSGELRQNKGMAVALVNEKRSCF
jgi:hypothetical protein